MENCCKFCGLELIPEDPVGDVCADCLVLDPPERLCEKDVLIEFLRQRIADQDRKLNEAFAKEVWMTFQLVNNR